MEAQASISYKWCLTQHLNIYSNPSVYFYCSPVQGRIAGASTIAYEFDSVVGGQHIYKNA